MEEEKQTTTELRADICTKKWGCTAYKPHFYIFLFDIFYFFYI